MKRLVSLFAVLAALAIAAPALAGPPPPQQAKLDRALQRALNAGAPTQAVIVRVKAGEETRVRTLVASHGSVHGTHGWLNAFSASVRTADLPALAADDAVLSI